jgi:hypothetical protein
MRFFNPAPSRWQRSRALFCYSLQICAASALAVSGAATETATPPITCQPSAKAAVTLFSKPATESANNMRPWLMMGAVGSWVHPWYIIRP